jgi:hypothetical protein
MTDLYSFPITLPTISITFLPGSHAIVSLNIINFPVSWDLEQLGLSEFCSEEILAAEILERQGYRTCIVSDLASVVYGSDVAIGDIHIAVADDAVQSARETLLEHGYSEEAQTNLGLRSLGPAKDSTSGWPGVRLRRPSAKEYPLGILLIPSSLWHLDLNGPSYFSDTMLFPRSMCRFPRLELYLNGEIQFFSLYLSNQLA